MATLDHILVVVVDRDICEMLRDYLESEGFRVSAAQDGAGMRRVMATEAVSLVILDLMLRGEDGLTLARELREARPRIGILILTGQGDTVDKIIGLEMGADDYLSKPFHLRELLARMRSVLRRMAAMPSENGGDRRRSRARFSGWELDLAARDLVTPGGAAVRLTTGEFDLLAAFVTNPNQVLSRDQLLALARNREAGPLDRAIDVQVGRLRRKLGDDPETPRLIKTVRGIGYIFTPAVEMV
jgi:two-component system, OmpR family, response regulator